MSGGSITGPALALRLLQQGFQDVHAYEASPQPTVQAGGIIGLEHAALGVLDTVGVPRDEMIPYPSERVVTIKGADQLEAGRVQTIYPGRNTVWQLINDDLLSRLPSENLHTGMRAAVIDRSVPLCGESGQPPKWVDLDEEWESAFPEDRARIRAHVRRLAAGDAVWAR